MAGVWVQELDGTRLVRADAIQEFRGRVSGGAAEVRAYFGPANESILVWSIGNVSEPGNGYDVKAVEAASIKMTHKVVEEIHRYEARGNTYHVIADFAKVPVESA